MRLREPRGVKIIAKRTFGKVVELEFEAASPMGGDPGQFVHVSCERWGLILRRPYSLSGARGRTASILVREVGAGSAWLCAVEVGQALDIMGPLGRGFTVGAGGGHVLVAGGTGVAPLIFLAARLKEQGEEARLLWGIEKEEDYSGLPDEVGKDFDLHLATMSGDAGNRGSVVDILTRTDIAGADNLYACGPKSMLTAVAEACDEHILGRLQVCLEERMACGIGACRGCAVPAAAVDGGYLAACKDGPVFWGRELDWKRLETLSSG
jgi:dihydroorotate dehydrogenase electron transfer subunit